jgi:hypothetical protein
MSRYKYKPELCQVCVLTLRPCGRLFYGSTSKNRIPETNHNLFRDYPYMSDTMEYVYETLEQSIYRDNLRFKHLFIIR